MRVTFGRGNRRQSVELPHAEKRNHDSADMKQLVTNIEERVLHPNFLLERKGFRINSR